MWLFAHPAFSLLAAHAISIALLHARARSVRRRRPEAGHRLAQLGGSNGRLVALAAAVALFVWPQVRALSEGVALTGRFSSASFEQSPVAFWVALCFWFALSSLFAYALLVAISRRMVGVAGER
jgi:hypothetical protein